MLSKLKLNGNKSYMVGLALIVYGGLAMLGQIDINPEVLTMLAGGGLVFLRSGVDKKAPAKD